MTIDRRTFFGRAIAALVALPSIAKAADEEMPSSVHELRTIRALDEWQAGPDLDTGYPPFDHSNFGWIVRDHLNDQFRRGGFRTLVECRGQGWQTSPYKTPCWLFAVQNLESERRTLFSVNWWRDRGSSVGERRYVRTLNDMYLETKYVALEHGSGIRAMDAVMRDLGRLPRRGLGAG